MSETIAEAYRTASRDGVADDTHALEVAGLLPNGFVDLPPLRMEEGETLLQMLK